MQVEHSQMCQDSVGMGGRDLWILMEKSEPAISLYLPGLRLVCFRFLECTISPFKTGYCNSYSLILFVRVTRRCYAKTEW